LTGIFLKQAGAIVSLTALFYVEQRYAFGILWPLQVEINLGGYTVYWLSVSYEVDESNLLPEVQYVPNAEATIALNPVAVFAPRDHLSSFISGLKVQLFHYSTV
jgi:hypothetical protein